MARTPEEKAALVFRGAELLPVLRDYYASHPPEVPIRWRLDRPTAFPDSRQALATGRLVSSDGVVHRWVAGKTATGWRLDWRALTGWSGLRWGDFLSKRPTVPTVMRVTARYDDCWVGDFRDSKRYLCLRLTGPDSSEPGWAFVERASPVAESIRRAAGLFGPRADPWEPAVIAAERRLRAALEPGADHGPSWRPVAAMPSFASPEPTGQRSDEFRLTLRLSFPADPASSLLPQMIVTAGEGPDWLDPAVDAAPNAPALSQN